MHMVGSGQNDVVFEEVVVAGALESSVHVGSVPSEYGTSGVVTDVVAKVASGCIPEPRARLTEPTGRNGQDWTAPPSSSETALAAIPFARTSTG
jgi:hypothetical protein